MTLKTHLNQIREIVRQNLESSRISKKAQYDKRAKPQTLNVGEYVLLLMPTSEHKLISQWQGPYKILEQITPVTYRTELDPKRKSNQVYHVNLLKKWEGPAPSTILATEAVKHLFLQCIDSQLPDTLGQELISCIVPLAQVRLILYNTL